MDIKVTDESGNIYHTTNVTSNTDILGDCDWVESGDNGLNFDEIWTIEFDLDKLLNPRTETFTYVPNGYCVSGTRG
ncbi:MAG: hypothetical protein AAF624_10425, partial [Bacteroidota bacterium]